MAKREVRTEYGKAQKGAEISYVKGKGVKVKKPSAKAKKSGKGKSKPK